MEGAGAAVIAGAAGGAAPVGVDSDRKSGRFIDHRAAGVAPFGVGLIAHGVGRRTGIRPHVGLLDLVPFRIVKLDPITSNTDIDRAVILHQPESRALRLDSGQAGHRIREGIVNPPIVADAAIGRLKAGLVDGILIFRAGVLNGAG